MVARQIAYFIHLFMQVHSSHNSKELHKQSEKDSNSPSYQRFGELILYPGHFLLPFMLCQLTQ